MKPKTKDQFNDFTNELVALIQKHEVSIACVCSFKDIMDARVLMLDLVCIFLCHFRNKVSMPLSSRVSSASSPRESAMLMCASMPAP